MDINLLETNNRKGRNGGKNKSLSTEKELLVDTLDHKEIREILDALQSSEDKYKSLQENVPIGLYQTSPDGQFIFVNNWIAHILGYESPLELMDKKVIDLYVDPSLREAFLGDLNKNGKLDRTQVELYKKDGSKIWVVISAKTVYDNKSNALNYDGYMYDITARIDALEKLKDSEEMFRAISDNLKNALYIFDETGEFIYVNPAMTSITGYSEKELLGQKILWHYPPG